MSSSQRPFDTEGSDSFYFLVLQHLEYFSYMIKMSPYEPMRSEHGDLLNFSNFRSIPGINGSCKSVLKRFWMVLVHSGKLYQFAFSFP